VFTSEELGSDVEDFLLEFLPALRRLSKELRLNQLIEHRRSGRHLLTKVVQHLPSRAPSEVGPEAAPTVETSYEDDSGLSTRTECDDDFGKVEDVEELIQAEAPDSQFFLI
jgi:hypothetical protein